MKSPTCTHTHHILHESESLCCICHFNSCFPLKWNHFTLYWRLGAWFLASDLEQYNGQAFNFFICLKFFLTKWLIIKILVSIVYNIHYFMSILNWENTSARCECWPKDNGGEMLWTYVWIFSICWSHSIPHCTAVLQVLWSVWAASIGSRDLVAKTGGREGEKKSGVGLYILPASSLRVVRQAGHVTKGCRPISLSFLSDSNCSCLLLLQ